MKNKKKEGISKMEIGLIALGALMILSAAVLYYAEKTGKDETKLEKIIENAIETEIERDFHLPSDAMDGKLDFLVQKPAEAGLKTATPPP